MKPDLKEIIRNVGVILLTSYFTIAVLLSFAAIVQHEKILDQQERIQKQEKEIKELKESLFFYIESSQKK